MINKLFIQERPLFLFCDNEQDAASFELFSSYSSVNEFRQSIELFEKETQLKSMGIRFASEEEKQNALNSIFTKIEAAGGIVKNKQGQLLFIFRHGKWDLPKGKIEKGENEQAAALREVEEECGIAELTLQKKLTTTFHTYYLKDTPILKASHWYLMNYTGNSTQLIPQTEEHISDARWMNAAEIQEALKNTYASIAEVMRLYYL